MLTSNANVATKRGLCKTYLYNAKDEYKPAVYWNTNGVNFFINVNTSRLTTYPNNSDVLNNGP